MNIKRVLVALSGGVDSSVCVKLLQQQGYEVAAVVMKMSPAHENTVLQAKTAADFLGVKLYVKDCSDIFETQVISRFVSDYQSGKTPNPCIICNPLVKFKVLLDTADENGFDMIATGHYAKVIKTGLEYAFYRSPVTERDQSYVLYRLGQDVLSRLLLPLAEMPKQEVREFAAMHKLPAAALPDSQEICFIPDNDYGGYIRKYFGEMPPGEFVAPDGNVCGRHRGIYQYTVGQRKGLGIALGKPAYIKKIDSKENRIYLAFADEDLLDCIRISDICGCVNSGEYKVKIRSAATPVPAFVDINGSEASVRLKTAVRAPSSGQSVVIYDGDRVAGGGFII